MLRLSSIIRGMFMLLALLTAAQAQRPRQPVGPVHPPNPLITAQPSPPSASAAPPSNVAQPQPQIPQPQAQQSVPTGPLVAPVVTFRDGLLTVQALNSSLSSVISAIRNKTGIEFEGLEGSSERVAISLGPASEGEVLASIFSGSRFDFVAIGRADSPGIVQRVILSPRNKTGAPGEVQAQARPAANADGDDEDVPDEQVNAGGSGDPQDTAVQPPPQPPPQAQAQPKTPEQMLQELQEMRRQKQSPPGQPGDNQAPRKTPPLQ